MASRLKLNSRIVCQAYRKVPKAGRLPTEVGEDANGNLPASGAARGSVRVCLALHRCCIPASSPKRAPQRGMQATSAPFQGSTAPGDPHLALPLGGVATLQRKDTKQRRLAQRVSQWGLHCKTADDCRVGRRNRARARTKKCAMSAGKVAETYPVRGRSVCEKRRRKTGKPLSSCGSCRVNVSVREMSCRAKGHMSWGVHRTCRWRQKSTRTGPKRSTQAPA